MISPVALVLVLVAMLVAPLVAALMPLMAMPRSAIPIAGPHGRPIRPMAARMLPLMGAMMRACHIAKSSSSNATNSHPRHESTVTRWLMAAMLPGPMLARALLRVASWGRIIARLWVARSALRVSTRWVIASSRVVTPLLRMAPLLRVATTAAAAPWIAGGCAIAAALWRIAPSTVSPWILATSRSAC